MSVRVYLPDDKVKALPGFQTIPRPDCGPTSKDHVADDGIKLYCENGRWYITQPDLGDEIHASLAGMVEEVTVRLWFYKDSYRETGIYKLDTAEAELTSNMPNQQEGYCLDIRGKKLEDARELYHQIRAGSIRPEASYKAPQGGLSYAELEAKVQKLSHSEVSLRTEVMELRRNNENLRGVTSVLDALYCEIVRGRRYFRSKKWLARRIQEAFLPGKVA